MLTGPEEALTLAERLDKGETRLMNELGVLEADLAVVDDVDRAACVKERTHWLEAIGKAIGKAKGRVLQPVKVRIGLNLEIGRERQTEGSISLSLVPCSANENVHPERSLAPVRRL